VFTSVAGIGVVVTGATRGIGKGIAQVFEEEGARVLVVGRNEEAARSTVEELSANGAEVSHVVADVSRRSDCQRMAAVAVERLGRIDVLCANAGIYPIVPIDQLAEGDIEQMFGTNLTGCVLSVQACLPALRQSGRGRIILTSSITGPITGLVGGTLYGASKAGQLGFMRSAAIELASSQITVNAVLPASVATAGLDEVVSDEWMAEMESAVPLGRLANVEDVAHAVLFLATAEAAYITGQTIVVDGGLTLREPNP
jgi:3-oxoacyl-[acyl-carrier protein] reductase